MPLLELSYLHFLVSHAKHGYVWSLVRHKIAFYLIQFQQFQSNPFHSWQQVSIDIRSGKVLWSFSSQEHSILLMVNHIDTMRWLVLGIRLLWLWYLLCSSWIRLSLCLSCWLSPYSLCRDFWWLVHTVPIVSQQGISDSSCLPYAFLYQDSPIRQWPDHCLLLLKVQW